MGADGKWQTFKKDELLQNNDITLSYPSHLMKASDGTLWFTNDYWVKPSFYSYDTANDALVAYNIPYKNQDGTEYTSNAVECIMESRNGDIWIGGNGGPAYLPKSHIGTDDQSLVQPKVPRNDGTNLADYLLGGININCMAEDAAGRKWFGTFDDGVYLIDNDNTTELQHFTTENSPLLDNEIESIAINDKTGEVFFGTNRGLCSYMSDASSANEEMTTDNVYAYPNPVKPDFNGMITVVGLSP